MRPILAIALAIGLLLAPVALASGGADDVDDRRGKGRETAGSHDAAGERRGRGADDGNETDRANWTRAAGGRHERPHDDNATHGEGRGENGRPAWVQQILSFRLAWRENATAIRETCHAQETPDGANWTKEQKLERAQCVREGYKGFLESFRDELRELRERLRNAAH